MKVRQLLPGQGHLPALRYHAKNNIMMDAQSRYWLIVSARLIRSVVAACASNPSWVPRYGP